MQYLPVLQTMRNHFNSGVTMSFAFRKKQLLALRSAVLKYENEISAALYTDLKKSVEEAYATEIGLFLAEINTTIKKLRSWMQPESAPSNLVNLPSTNKIYR